MPDFLEQQRTPENYWRAVILFGQNVASYKFALAKSLIDLGAAGQTAISLEALAEPFSRHILEHLGRAPKQATSASSRFLEACRSFSAGKIAQDELIGSTVKVGFNNVIDAFHVVNRSDIPVMSTRNPLLNRSAAIHASCGPLTCRPPATTAASMRSRRLPGTPRSEKTVSGIRHNCSVMAARVTLKAINDELLRRGHNARLERASGYFYFFGDEATDWIDRTVPVTTVNALTLDQWADEFKRLKKVNREIMGKPPRANQGKA